MPASEVGDQSRAEAAEAMATGRAARRERDGEQAGAEAGDAADARSELEHAEAAQAREEAEDGAAGAAAQAGHAAGGEQRMPSKLASKSRETSRTRRAGATKSRTPPSRLKRCFVLSRCRS